MRYYLVDASAFVYAIEQYGNTKLDFFEEKAQGSAFIYLPQFCVTEVFNTFGKCFYKRIRGKQYTKQQYQNSCKFFQNAIRNRATVYVYDLHRYHNIRADSIIPVEHTTPYAGKERYLSAFDILIISMTLELMEIHKDSEVCLLTRDIRMKRIAELLNINAQYFE